MFLLRSLFRGLTSSILRLAIFAGVLFLCYLFILRPALNKAGDAIDSTKSKPQKLLACAKRSHGDVKRLQRCVRSF